jgi:hypothetical protein
MLLGLWPNYWDDWLLYHKCNFDGIRKLIIVHPEVTSLDVKTDIYSDWKEWVQLRDNAKYLQAIRSIGGDPIGGGKYAGDIYFLINGWKVYFDHSVNVTGIIYSDDGLNPFTVPTDTNIVTNTVSNLVQSITTGGGGGADDVWNYILESGYSAKMLIRLLAAVQMGKTDITNLGGGNAQVAFRDVNDSKDRVIANMTGSERTSVTLDPS